MDQVDRTSDAESTSLDCQAEADVIWHRTCSLENATKVADMWAAARTASIRELSLSSFARAPNDKNADFYQPF